MIEQELVKSLREFIKDAVKDFRLPVETEKKPRAPKVYDGYLPPKRSENGDDFPLIIVRPESATTEREETEVSVAIIVGCYTEEFDGHEYCLNVMTRIRNALTSMENGILAKKYVLKFPITWNIVPEQPWPQWELEIDTKWCFNTPQAITDF